MPASQPSSEMNDAITESRYIWKDDWIHIMSMFPGKYDPCELYYWIIK